MIIFNLAMPRAYAALTTVGICCSAFMSIPITIGLLTASLCRTAKSLNIATSLLYFPMLLFSGATVPAEIFPKGLRFFSDILPLGIGINLLKSVSMGIYEGTAIPAVFLCAVTVVCTVSAVKTFRWE